VVGSTQVKGGLPHFHSPSCLPCLQNCTAREHTHTPQLHHITVHPLEFASYKQHDVTFNPTVLSDEGCCRTQLRAVGGGGGKLITWSNGKGTGGFRWGGSRLVVPARVQRAGGEGPELSQRLRPHLH